MNKILKAFLRPRLTRKYWLRVGIVAVVALIVFGIFLKPCRIQGISMAPTYRDGGFVLGFRQRYLFRDPHAGDVVLIRYAGERVMMLKRVVAVAGQTVAFRNGVLRVDGKEQDEPYVKGPCDWNLEARTVDPGHIYVIGHNRSMDIDVHLFGQVTKKRVTGAPLW